MKHALLIANLLLIAHGAAFAFGGTGVSEGPVILSPSMTSIASFANQNLPRICQPIDGDQINEIGPIGKNNMDGFIYSFATICRGVRRTFRVETSGGTAPQPERLTTAD